MADSNTLIATDPVHQFSVFVENRVGRLHELTALLKSNNVHVMAITILDSTDSTMIFPTPNAPFSLSRSAMNPS